jgi:hypothetical protein
MVRIRTAWFVAAVAALALGGACKKNDDAKKTDDKSAPKTTAGGTPGAPGTTIAANDANGSDLSLLPADSEIVVGVNLGQIQQSALYKQFIAKFMDKASSGLAEFKANCGFDPVESIKSIAIGMKNVGGGGGAVPDGVIVIHGPDKAKVMACFSLDKAKASASAKGTELKVDGDIAYIKDKSGNTTAFTFVNDTTMLGVMGSKATADGIKDAAKGASALKSSATFVDMYSKINTQDSIWGLVNGNSNLLSKMGSLGIKPKAVFGSLNLSDGLTVDVRVRMSSADEVKGFVGLAQGQIASPQVKQLFDQLDVVGDGNDAKFSVKMSAAKLQALATMVQGTMGAMMGGMGGGGGGGMAGGMGGTP